MKPENFDFLVDKKNILKTIIQSKEDGTMIGICAPDVLGKDVCVTAVEDLILDLSDDQHIVVLKQYDANGYMLSTNVVNLNQIKSIYPFKSTFKNPYLKCFDEQE